MPPNDDEQGVLQNNVVTQLFVDTADQNYLVARWAYHHGLFNDFFWNAVHALEKYMKASLLLNGRSGIRNAQGKNFGHDLDLLLDEVLNYASAFVPNNLSQPEELPGVHWSHQSVTEFISRLNTLGDANNRYNLYGYTQRWEDLHHLDQCVWIFRRIAFDLDASPFIGPSNADPKLPQSVAEMLERHDSYSPRGGTSRLHKMLDGQAGEDLREAGLKLNFVFAPADHDHSATPVRIGFSTKESVLSQRIVRVAEYDEATGMDADAVELGEWILDNIYLPKSAKDELKVHLDIIRARN